MIYKSKQTIIQSEQDQLIFDIINSIDIQIESAYSVKMKCNTVATDLMRNMPIRDAIVIATAGPINAYFSARCFLFFMDGGKRKTIKQKNPNRFRK